jgi:PPOX class probable F420-dependent enzyme
MLRAADWDFVETQRVGHLATADGTGRPYVVPVCFARVGSTLYIPVDAKPKGGDPRALKRLRNLRLRPEAALVLDHYDEDWRHLRWLLIHVRARILEPGLPDGLPDGPPDGPPGAGDEQAERTLALMALMARYPQYAAMRLGTLDLPVVGLEPVAVRRWRARPAGVIRA